MILPLLILLPLVGGILAWAAGRASTSLPRWISLITMIIELILAVVVWLSGATGSPWLMELNAPWIPAFGINFHLGLDGISLLLVLLTGLLGIISVACSWEGITERVGFFHFMLLWIIAAIVGVFISLDLFLFYFFWEMTLVPLYFIIGIWGHENRIYATVKFFIFTQATSLFMLLAILGLYFINGRSTGTYTFDYNTLLKTAALPVGTAVWLCLGFLLAFLTKLPAVPLHTWLPDAHTEAPTAGSVILAGLVLKLGAYGILRFAIPLFPTALAVLQPWMMALGAIGILYGALVAYSQDDFKRLVAYTSVSHMGFALLGLFAWNQYAVQGALMVMLAHGLSTGGLFVIAGDLQDLMHTRDMRRMGGLWEVIPRYGGVTMTFAIASLGLPGLANFVGEILVLFGAYQANVTFAVIATFGFIVSTIYSLWLIQRAFQGPNNNHWQLPDMNLRQSLILGSLIALMVWMGIDPQPLINTAQPAVQTLLQSTGQPRASEIVPLPVAPLPPPGSIPLPIAPVPPVEKP